MSGSVFHKSIYFNLEASFFGAPRWLFGPRLLSWACTDSPISSQSPASLFCCREAVFAIYQILKLLRLLFLAIPGSYSRRSTSGVPPVVPMMIVLLCLAIALLVTNFQSRCYGVHREMINIYQNPAAMHLLLFCQLHPQEAVGMQLQTGLLETCQRSAADRQAFVAIGLLLIGGWATKIKSAAGYHSN